MLQFRQEPCRSSPSCRKWLEFDILVPAIRHDPWPAVSMSEIIRAWSRISETDSYLSAPLTPSGGWKLYKYWIFIHHQWNPCMLVKLLVMIHNHISFRVWYPPELPYLQPSAESQRNIWILHGSHNYHFFWRKKNKKYFVEVIQF